MKPTMKTGLADKRKNKDAIMSKPAIRAAVRAKAAEKNVSVPKSALDNFVDTYQKAKVGPIQRKIASFISGMNTKADYTNKNSTYAKLNTKAQANRAKSQGGPTAKQISSAEREKRLQADSKRALQAQADKIASKDANMNIKKAAAKSKNYNVGVSKGGVPFKEAFAYFRKKGAKTFTWNGKKYTTELSKKGKK